jgi:hypothetical protein
MPTERGKVVALKKNVLEARRKADAMGLGPDDITEGRMRQSIAAATKASIGDTGLADAAKQARMDDARRRLREGTASLPMTGFMSDVERPSILGPGSMKRGSYPTQGPPPAAAMADSPPASQDSLGSLGAMMSNLGKGRRRSKKSKKGGKKTKKGGRKTRRRA